MPANPELDLDADSVKDGEVSKALCEAAGVREELQRVYELVHFHGKASREAQQRAESAEKRLTDAMSALRTLADCDVDEDRSTVPELLEMAQRDRAFVQKRLAEAEALLDEVAATDCYGMPIGVAERIGDWKSKRSANQPPVETKRYVSGDQVYREHIPGYEAEIQETKACPECVLGFHRFPELGGGTRVEICKTCGGSGEEPAAGCADCPTCHGTGRIPTSVAAGRKEP